MRTIPLVFFALTLLMVSASVFFFLQGIWTPEEMKELAGNYTDTGVMCAILSVFLLIFTVIAADENR